MQPKIASFFLFLLLLTGCGYRFYQADSTPKTISVPYIPGDPKGLLVDAVCRSLTFSGEFRPLLSGGELRLHIALVGDQQEKIGYMYDREPVTGKLEKNLLPTEGRRILYASVSLIEDKTGEMVLGPYVVQANGSFDFVEPNTLEDVSFINCDGMRETTLNFSLGQLDSYAAGVDNVLIPIYRQLADEIVDNLIERFCLNKMN